MILSRDGWLKRVREVKDLSATRLREGDAVLAVLRGSTKEPLAFFSNLGAAYVMRINDVPPSTGYGEPVQKLFKFGDGERVVGALVARPRRAPPRGALALAVTKRGYGLRFDLDPHRELSTRAGPPVRQAGRGRRGGRRAPVASQDDVVCVVTARRAAPCSARPTRSPSWPTPAAASP